MRDTRLQSNDLTEDVILGPDQTLLYALNDFLPLDLILEVLLKDELAMALSIQFEVSGLFDVLLVDTAKLASHIVPLINVQYVLGLPVSVRPSALRHAHKGCWLGRVTSLSCGRSHRKVVGVLSRETGLSIVELQVSQIELQTHQLLRSVVHVYVNDASVSIV